MWRKILEVVLVGCLAAVTLTVVGVVVYDLYERTHPLLVERQTLMVGEHYPVKHIEVLQGHEFDVVLDNGKSYHVVLSGVIGTTPQAKELVVRYLNICREKGVKPIMVVSYWNAQQQQYAVDIYLGDEPLTTWLYAQNLAYSR